MNFVVFDFSDFAVPNLWISTTLDGRMGYSWELPGFLGRSILRPPWGRATCLVEPLELLRVEGPETGKHRGVGESGLSALM